MDDTRTQETTAIYGEMLGEEERKLAQRTWPASIP